MSARYNRSQANASSHSGSGQDTVNFTLAPNQVSLEDHGKDASVFVLDPDLQKDEDLPANSPRGSVRKTTGGRRQSSGRMSRESLSSKRTDVSNASRVVKSRSRPKKEHEADPFLSIDNLPQDATFVSEKSHVSAGVRRGRPNPPKSPSLVTWPRASAYATPFSHNSGPASYFHPLKRKAVTRVNSARSSSTARLSTGHVLVLNKKAKHKGSHWRSKAGTSYNSRAGNITPTQINYVSPNKEQKNPNYHVKMPFKHAVNKPDMTPDGVMSPSHELKERTALATYHINRILSLDDQPDVMKKHGRLQKAKLKPLYPVSIEGPSITQCRGIVSDAHSYGPSASRTLQRRQQLLKQIPNVHEYLYDRPHTVESLHQTSIASSADESHDNGEISDDSFDSNRSLPDEILYTTPKSQSVYTTPKSLSDLEKHNTRVNIAAAEKGETVQPSSREVTPTPRMFVTEVNSKSEKINAELAERLQNGSPVKETNNAEIITEKNNNAEINPSDRPSSVEGTSIRSKSPYKSVRFVEDAQSKEIKQMKNAKIAEQQQKLSQKNYSDDNTTQLKGHDTKKEDLNIMDLDEKKKKPVSKKGNVSCKEDAGKENEYWDKDDDNDDDKDNRKPKDGKRRTDDSTIVQGMNNFSTSNGGNSENKISESSETKGRKTNDSVMQNLEKAKVQHCSRYSQSQVSADLRPLQVHTVLHGDTVHNIIGAENRSRSPSPNRQNTSRVKPNNSTKSSGDKEQGFLFFSLKDDVQCDTEGFDYAVSRPKVKFQLERDEGEESKPSMFWESDTGDDILIGVRDDTDINFDTLESELELLQTSIQKNLSKEKELEEGLEVLTLIEENTKNEESKLKVSPRARSPFIDRLNLGLSKDLNSERSSNSNVAVDSVRDGGYSDLLMQYRLRCIQSWENCGEICPQSNQDDAKLRPRKMSSAGIIKTKRVSSANSDKHSQDSDAKQDYGVQDMESSQSSQQNSCRGPRSENYRGRSLSLDEGDQRKYQSIEREVLDSGCGSEDTLSEMSGTVTAMSDVPHLNLGSLSNGLDLTPKSDNRGDVNNHEGRNLLDIVCDHLSNSQSQKQVSEVSEEMNPLERLKKLRQRPRVSEERTPPDFQLVATAKMLSKPRNQKKDRAGPVPPFPPLYFSINARPPRGYLYYFAYGPEMNPDRFRMYIQRQILTRFWGTLFGFSLVFNKRGSDVEAGGFANIEFNPFSSVEGCIFKITQDELVLLDKYMGYPKVLQIDIAIKEILKKAPKWEKHLCSATDVEEHYEHLVLPVMMCNSLDPDQYGVAQYCVPALTYIAQDDWTEKDITLNCDYSVKQSLKGSDLLTPEYRNFLSNKLTNTITQEVTA